MLAERSSPVKKTKRKIAFVLGTRPEAIKLAPVIAECRRRADQMDTFVINTGQHQELLRPVLDFFSVTVDADLALMRPNQTLAELTSRILEALDKVFRSLRADCVVVQGDTTTAMAAALTAFYHKFAVAHVEAGLRTDDLYSPFPEEMNRRTISQIARWHFAPTPLARTRLEREAVPSLGGRIVVTGNPVIDALYQAVRLVRENPPADPDLEMVQSWKSAGAHRRVILVTGHRRENFGSPFAEFCSALREIGRCHADVLLVYPVHLNPNVQAAVKEVLTDARNVHLSPPKDYPTFVALMQEADLLITDSGGVQEEAPALGKPVLVTRSTTERPEGIQAGAVLLVGTDHRTIVREVNRLISERAQDRHLMIAGSPFGDGKASERIVQALLDERVEEFCPCSRGRDPRRGLTIASTDEAVYSVR